MQRPGVRKLIYAGGRLAWGAEQWLPICVPVSYGQICCYQGEFGGHWRKKRIRMALWTIGSVLSEQVYWNLHVERG